MALIASVVAVSAGCRVGVPMLLRSKNHSLSLGAFSPAQIVTPSRLTVMPIWVRVTVHPSLQKLEKPAKL
jgi:hypothetical protein